MLRTPPHTPQRPPLSRRPITEYAIETESETLLEKVIKQGYPSTRSVLQVIGMEDQYNFVKDKHQVMYYMMGFAGAGPGLASSSMRVGPYEQDAIQLKENIHVLRGSAKERLRWLKEQTKATEEILKIADNLDEFSVEFDEVNMKAKTALSGGPMESLVPAAAPIILAAGAEPATATTSTHADAKDVFMNNSFPAESPATSFNFGSGSLQSPEATSFNFSTGIISSSLFNNSPTVTIENGFTPNTQRQKIRRING